LLSLNHNILCFDDFFIIFHRRCLSPKSKYQPDPPRASPSFSNFYRSIGVWEDLSEAIQALLFRPALPN